MSETFWEKVKKVNAILEAQGASIVQEIDKRKQETKDKYPTTADYNSANVYYGYKSQAIFDAVNEAFGVENWKYMAVVKTITTQAKTTTIAIAIAKVKVYFRLNKPDEEEKWFCKGTQYGGATVLFGNIPDAKKGAITDGLGKCFSLYGIGTKAYRGELKEVYFGKQPKKEDRGGNKTKARENIVHKDNDEKFPEETYEKPPEKQEAKKEAKTFKPKNPNEPIREGQTKLLFVRLKKQGLSRLDLNPYLRIKLGIEELGTVEDKERGIKQLKMGQVNEVLEYVDNFYPIVDGDPDALKPDDSQDSNKGFDPSSSLFDEETPF